MKFLIDNIFLVTVAIFSGLALLWPTLQKRANQVTTLQATQLINQSKTLVLDVRESEAFTVAHLIDAKNIPLRELPQRLRELDKFKTKKIIVVCQTGRQAGKAIAQLGKAGFTQVYVLAGGISGWQAQGLPVVR